MSNPAVASGAGSAGVCASAWAQGFACDPAARSWAPYLGTGIVVAAAVAAIVYVTPTVIAFRRRCTWRWYIALLNLATGLSGIGWFLALWMALAGSVEAPRARHATSLR